MVDPPPLFFYLSFTFSQCQLRLDPNPRTEDHELIVVPGNTKGGSITVPLTSCLTCLDSSVLQIKTKIVSCHTGDSKPVKQEVNCTVILPTLVFPGCTFSFPGLRWLQNASTRTLRSGSSMTSFRDQFYKTFYDRHLQNFHNKLECLSLASLFNPVYCLRVRPELTQVKHLSSAAL
jgi:hypothetical protein